MIDTIELDALIARLGSEQPRERINAREALVEASTPAVPRLIAAIRDSRDVVRWEAAKALGKMRSSAAIPELVDALSDEDVGVRWLAAEALIAQGPACVEPLLCSLVDRPLNSAILNGAHHVLHDVALAGFEKTRISLLEAFESPSPNVGVPLAAETALRSVASRAPA